MGYVEYFYHLVKRNIFYFEIYLNYILMQIHSFPSNIETGTNLMPGKIILLMTVHSLM